MHVIQWSGRDHCSQSCQYPLLRVALCEIASTLELHDSSTVVPLWWLTGWYSVAAWIMFDSAHDRKYLLVDGRVSPDSDLDGRASPDSDLDGRTSPVSNLVGRASLVGNLNGIASPNTDLDGRASSASDLVGRASLVSNLDGEASPETDLDGRGKHLIATRP